MVCGTDKKTQENGYLNFSIEEQSRWDTVLPASLELSSRNNGFASSLLSMLKQALGLDQKPDVLVPEVVQSSETDPQ